MDLMKMSVEQLKAMAYDRILMGRKIESELATINQALGEKIKQEKAKPEPKKEDVK